MKKTIFLIFCLLFTAIGFSQKQRCTIYFNDGTTLAGLGRLKDDGTVKFKATEDSKNEIISKGNIEKVELNEEGTIEVYKYKRLSSDFQKWLKEIVNGEVSLYTSDVSGMYGPSIGTGFSTMGGVGGGIAFGTGGNVTYYYVCHKLDTAVFRITSFGNISKNFKNTASEYFKDCPELVKKIEDKTFKKDDIEEVVRFYNTHCAVNTETKTAEKITN
ncbi:hypothetical protein [Flavobacterium sp.]|uniref:hypothetical protein n=1 Tax=Flavobacterium sp. TaxID=239 RepID=UPI0026027A83|nr:hypothetical protein [Flavobacterium sp.]